MYYYKVIHVITELIPKYITICFDQYIPISYSIFNNILYSIDTGPMFQALCLECDNVLLIERCLKDKSAKIIRFLDNLLPTTWFDNIITVNV